MPHSSRRRTRHDKSFQNALLEELRHDLAKIAGLLDRVQRHVLLGAELGEVLISVAVGADDREISVAHEAEERLGVGAAAILTADVHGEDLDALLLGRRHKRLAALELRGDRVFFDRA